MKFLFFLSLTASFLFGCNTTKPVTSMDQVISVTHGTNFGHCRGYCRKEVVFTEGQTEYIESSVDSAKNPVKVENFKNTSASWKSSRPTRSPRSSLTWTGSLRKRAREDGSRTNSDYSGIRGAVASQSFTLHMTGK